MAGVTSATRTPWRRPSKGEERRADLLAALQELLEDKRFAEIGVDDIARAAGVRRTAFYFYFGSKAMAVAALLADAFDQLIDGAADWLSGGDTPEVALRQALTGVWQFWRSHDRIMVAMLDARDNDAEVRVLWDEWLERFVAPVAFMVESERAASRAGPGPDARTLVRTLVGANAVALERLSRSEADEATSAAVLDVAVHVWTSALYPAGR
ncbi:TetR/AcrR family transcriptional regulator [Pseudonocardia sp. NPDC049154]|uniref:TetR/AcrR family transcriptional regulator n=1 Tax=Pseudonocardia sp. NPDC049154 TaxID=3155501 RepID=UPI0033ED3AC3